MIRTIYLVHHTHTDIGYTDTIGNVLSGHVKLLDRVVRLCRANASRTDGLRYKWTVETALVLDEYRRRSPTGFADLMALTRDRLIEVCGLWTQSLSELPSLQELIHLVGKTVDLGREQGFAVRSAMLNDIQCGAGALPDVLAAAGVPYLVNGPNTYRTLMPLATDLPPLFRWQGPVGKGSVLLWQFRFSAPDDVSKLKSLYPQYALGYFHVLWPLRGWYDPVKRKYLYDPIKERFVGAEPTPRQCLAMARRGIVELCERLEAHRYPYDAILLQAGADNFGPDERICETVERWNNEIGTPIVRIATPCEFFEHIEREYGGRIPTLKGHISDPWSDHSATKAEEMARYRQALRTLRTAGRTQTLSMLAGDGAAGDGSTFENAVQSLLMTSEHTYGLNTFALNDGILDGKIDPADQRLDGPLKSWQLKARYSRSAERASAQLLKSSMASLAKCCAQTEPGVLVVNDLDHRRGGLVEIPSAKATGSPGVVLRDVPPGASWYPLRKLTGQAARRRTRAPGGDEAGVLQSERFSLRVDPRTGAISSLVDRRSGRELIDHASEWQANQLICERIFDFPRDTGNGGITVPCDRSHMVADPGSVRIRPLAWAGGPALEIVSIVRSDSAPIRLKSVIRLPAYADRVEFINRVTRAPSIVKGAIYFAFPFVVPRSQFSVRCDVAGGVITLGKDQLPGSTGDFQAIQGAVAIDSAAGSVLWASPDAPLVCVGGMFSMRWRTGRDRPERPHLFSYAMHNTWPTNCPLWQTARSELRYAISATTERADASDIIAFGRDFASPLKSVLTPIKRTANRGKLPRFECSGAVVEATEPLSDHEVRIFLSGLNASGGTARLRLTGSRKIKQIRRHDSDGGGDAKTTRISGGAFDVPLSSGGLTIITATIG